MQPERTIPGPKCPSCVTGKTSYVLTLGVDHPEQGRITALEVSGFSGAVEAIDLARKVKGARADLAYEFIQGLHPNAVAETDELSRYQLVRYRIVGASLNEGTDEYGTTDTTDLY